jgi:drug/metabolite transporter (DMT)-like permease
MGKDNEKTNKKSWWFTLGLLAVVIGAPNAMVARTALSGDNSTDSLTLLVLKFSIILITLFVPFYRFVRAKYSVFRGAFKNLMIMAICNVVATSTWIVAVEQSSASYASIIALLSPILLVILSARLVKDRVTRRAAAGITLAAVGGLLVVALPALLHGSTGSGLYPVATVLMLINCVVTPLTIIYQRRSHEQGVPLAVSIATVALVAVPILVMVYILTRGGGEMVETVSHLPWQVWLAALYTGIAVSYVSRSLAVRSYEHTGAAVKGGLSYLETLLAIALPLLILGEQLSIEMVAGAMLILVGVFLAESGGKHHLFKMGFKWHPHHLHHHGRVR